LGHIAAAYRGDTANPSNLATYISWPWRYQVASIIIATGVVVVVDGFQFNDGVDIGSLLYDDGVDSGLLLFA
jgi:hypothetical protein